MQNKDLSATWINEYCRNKNDGKCTIKLKCENQSPVCTCTSKVICSAPRKHTSDKSSKGFKKLLKTGRIKITQHHICSVFFLLLRYEVLNLEIHIHRYKQEFRQAFNESLGPWTTFKLSWLGNDRFFKPLETYNQCLVFLWRGQ